MQDLFEFITPSTILEILFGLIISILIFYIDSRGKSRQELSLKRQDDALDIILDQVSKVNAFQTKSLALAIETLGHDIELLNQKLNTLNDKNSVSVPKVDPAMIENKPIDKKQTDQAIKSGVIGSVLSKSFGSILNSQINNMVDQINKSVSEIVPSEENDYKRKKELSFDLKNLLRGVENLKELEHRQKAIRIKVDKSDQKINEETGDNLKSELQKLDKLDSFDGLISFANNFLTSLGKTKGTNENSTIQLTKKTRKKIKPDKIRKKEL